MSITETLEGLRQLQNVDGAINALESELEELPKRLERIRQDLSAVEEKHKSADEILAGVLKRRRELEQQIADTDQNVIKFENDKIKVKTNEEFRALNVQIEQVKTKKSELEDQVLLNYDEEETAAENAKKLKSELDQVAESTKVEGKRIEARAEEDRKQLAELQGKRGGLVEKMMPQVMSRYEVIRTRGGGAAVVNILRGACGGCHTAQPPQKVNEIRKKEAIFNCDFCGRFLLWNVEEATAS